MTINPVSVSDGGTYMCKFDDGAESEERELKVEVRNRVDVILQPNWPQIFRGETITLSCEIQDVGDTEWEYEWRTPSSETPPQHKEYRISRATASHSGDYSCRGRRDYLLTQWSDVITLTVSADRPKPTLTADKTIIPERGAVTLSCSVEGSADWKYYWFSRTSRSSGAQRLRDGGADKAITQGGLYHCRGGRGDPETFTQDSDPVTIQKTALSCRVKDPSAGWRFFWFKAVPKLSGNYYDQELLPGSSNGTEQDSYIVHGQTHTAGYKCRAGRGDPVYYTYYSEPKFVWSGDFHSSASLTVSPDRVQHFTSDSVSLSCEGNSTEWRVRRFTEDDYPSYSSYCSYWGTMTGSTCSINSYWQSDAVYWCESGSGEFSNAVNITIQNEHIILVSPVRPVTEGDPVSLSCKFRTEKLVSDVFFYRNDKLIQNDSRRELNISAVLKSDEGFYKCQHSGEESAQSWMSVKVSRPESSSVPVPLIVGLVCGIVLILLLLLLYRYRPSKDSCSIRPIQSESTNRGSAENYSSPVHVAAGDAPLYETIKGFENTQSVAVESQGLTYSLIELKNVRKKKKRHEPEEVCVYSEVNTWTADDSLMYAQVNRRNKGKAKKNKGKSPTAAADETVYFEVKPGTALDNNLMYAQVNLRNKGKAKKNKGKSPPAAADEVKPGTALGL
ncbi:uncharacterized protein LOC123979847 [Micropterus dolomieu]|uniref:uncharacterized protein LOC123979847 n=1 Tax=Micropterus dolomieu TaxID=147949 RepID=UPI001E8E23A6|nr:uncharacterized protein LOC123979847 [Micropterus dolomieu]